MKIQLRARHHVHDRNQSCRSRTSSPVNVSVASISAWSQKKQGANARKFPSKQRNKTSRTVFWTFSSTSLPKQEKGLENLSCQYNKTKQAAMGEKRTLNEVSDGSFKCCEQPILSIDALIRRPQNASCSLRPVATLAKSRVDKTAEDWSVPENAKALPPPELSQPWPRPLSLPLSSKKNELKKHRLICHKTEMSMLDYLAHCASTLESVLGRQFLLEHQYSSLLTSITSSRLARTTKRLWLANAVPPSSNWIFFADTANIKETLYPCRRLPNLSTTNLVSSLWWYSVKLTL